MDLHEVPKKFQYITVDSNFVNGSNNTFSFDLNLESNLHVEDMTKVLGIKMVDFYITQVGAQEGGTPFTPSFKIDGINDYEEGLARLSLDGKRVVVGGSNADTANGVNSGRLKVYERVTSDNWVQVGGDIIGDSAGNRFGRGRGVCINNTGSRVAGGTFNANYVKIFEYNVVTGNWDQMGSTITGVSQSKFGHSISMNAAGDMVCIGCPEDDSLASNSRHHGSVKVLSWNGSAWSQRGNTLYGIVDSGDKLGWDVAMSADGSRIVAGAPTNDNNVGTDAGSMHIYEWDGTNYTEMTGSPLLGTGYQDEGGTSVTISADGTTAALGVPYCNENVLEEQGAVRVFRYLTSLNTWDQIGVNLEGDGEYDQFGMNVKLNGNGNRLVVGAPELSDPLGLGRGYIKVFDYEDTTNTWNILKEKYIPPLNLQYIGNYSVDIDVDGNTMIAGGSTTGSPGVVQIFEPSTTGSNIPKYVDIVCPDIPKSAQILDERHGQILARVPLERHFTETSTTILRDKQWRRFQQKTNYFNPISIKKLNFNIYEEQDDGDYLTLKPDSKWYMILEIATVNVKEKPRNRELQILDALDRLMVKIGDLNHNVKKLPDAEQLEKARKETKKYPFSYLVLMIILILVGVYYITSKQAPPPPRPSF